MKFFRKITKKEDQTLNSKDAAKERLHLVLMQDRANVSADFLELMKQEIIEVIKKYIEVDENAIDVRLTNKDNGDGTKGAPALYANIPIMNIKDEIRPNNSKNETEEKQQEEVDKPKEEENVIEEMAEAKEEPEANEKNSSEENKKKRTKKVIHEDQSAKKQKVTVKNTEN